MITLTAKLTAKAEKLEEVKQGLHNLVSLTTKEEGCVQYVLHQDVNNPNIFVFYEQFQDQTAFEFHSNAPYIKEFFGKAEELLAVPAELTFLMKL